VVGPEINLVDVVGNGHKYELAVSNETPEDAAARREKDAKDAALKRMTTFVLFLFALAVVGSVFVGCVYVFATGTPEDKKWSAGIVSAIASGLVGFLVGQGKK
jgi:predicted cation transporter